MIELAWAAGFFDGEGCTSVPKNSKALRVNITQQHPEVLYRFRDAVGVGKVLGPYELATGKLMWNWYASTKPGIVALGKLWPYLSSEKRNQALLKLSVI